MYAFLLLLTDDNTRGTTLRELTAGAVALQLWYPPINFIVSLLFSMHNQLEYCTVMWEILLWFGVAELYNLSSVADLMPLGEHKPKVVQP